MATRGQDRIADLVDRFLAEGDKALAGSPDWSPGNRDGEMRLSMPVMVKGQASPVHFQITAYPNEATLRFTLTLNWPPCFWRVDFDPPHKRHHNPLKQVAALGGAYEVCGPSFHSWADNRHLATPTQLPMKLDCARPLEGKIRTFDAELRWFCSQTKIKLGPRHGISLPERTQLI